MIQNIDTDGQTLGTDQSKQVFEPPEKILRIGYGQLTILAPTILRLMDGSTQGSRREEKVRRILQ